MKKQYTYEKVIYGYNLAHKKWNFQINTVNFITQCPGGIKTANKVARIIYGSFKRCGAIDNMARANINRLTI